MSIDLLIDPTIICNVCTVSRLRASAYAFYINKYIESCKLVAPRKHVERTFTVQIYGLFGPTILDDIACYCFTMKYLNVLFTSNNRLFSLFLATYQLIGIAHPILLR